MIVDEIQDASTHASFFLSSAITKYENRFETGLSSSS